MVGGASRTLYVCLRASERSDPSMSIGGLLLLHSVITVWHEADEGSAGTETALEVHPASRLYDSPAGACYQNKHLRHMVFTGESFHSGGGGCSCQHI